MTRTVSAPTGVEWFVQNGGQHRTASPESPRAFHRRLPGYERSPLVDAAGVAEELGLGAVLIKDESSRIGLQSFKILGASWAIYRALRSLGDFADGAWESVEDLAGLVRQTTKVRKLAAATDGNHGRAVAHVARLLGLECVIYVPTGMADARIEGLQSEGASVTIINGGYEDAVNASAHEATEKCLVISDTSWDGYVEVPTWVMEGYSTIFEEVEEQAREFGVDAFDLVVAQAGVGSLAAAAVKHFRSASEGPRMLCVEPTAAACILASMQHGERVSIRGPHDSIMVGLNCDTPSLVAWPDVSQGFDAYVALNDDGARAAMRTLATEGVVSGETGASGLAGLFEVTTGEARPVGEALGLDGTSRVLVISTEGATDPVAYDKIVGGNSERNAT